ncbi:hypothetical protein QBC47DRAFT_40676 [Echria macrotheca]|uniref:Cellobiose dehydrogenase-like cytochrome domain-containing protein n=1 Tax=Echria macrotheca TaxID=438768 RepID=A0AAJ0BC06_9PEZI|nr:hypothetical protein QBC47DRAFT_40676 [Echria macrotheca]
MHLPRALAGVASALSLSSRQFEPDSVAYSDAATGLKFASYSSDGHVQFRVAVPSTVTAGTEFDAVLQVVAPVSMGWAGFAWGGSMTYNPLAIVWANGTNNVVLSSRIAYGYYTPPVYTSANYTILKTGTHVNATHFQVTALCKGCSKWGDEETGITEIDPTQQVTFGFAYSSNQVDHPADIESSFGIHDSTGHPIFELAVAKNDNFAATVAKL